MSDPVVNAASRRVPLRRAYPIETPNHTKSAMARLADHGDAAQRKALRDAVSRRYPGIKLKGTPT